MIRDDANGWFVTDSRGNEFGPLRSYAEAEEVERDAEDEIAGRRVRIPDGLLKLLEAQWALEDDVQNAEEALKILKARLKFLGESEIPEALTERELNNGARLPDGREVTFARTFHASIAKGDKAAAYAYLDGKGFGALFRRTVTVSLGKDSVELAREFRDALADLLPSYEISVRAGEAPEKLVAAVRAIFAAAGLAPEIEETLELPGPTLGAWVRTEMRRGHPIPECITVYTPMKAVLSVADVKPAPQSLSSEDV